MTRPRGRPRKVEDPELVECAGCDAKIDGATCAGNMDTGPLCPSCAEKEKAFRADRGLPEDEDDEGDDVEELEFGEGRERDLGGEEDEG